MKYIKPMNIKEFSDFLATLKTGDKIDFGTGTYVDQTNEIPDPYDVEGWYFATVMEISEYGSHFILIDYAGGEEAFAIPLNSYKHTCDEDDKYIIAKYTERFFLSCPDIIDKVYVELDDEEET